MIFNIDLGKKKKNLSFALSLSLSCEFYSSLGLSLRAGIRLWHLAGDGDLGVAVKALVVGFLRGWGVLISTRLGNVYLNLFTFLYIYITFIYVCVCKCISFILSFHYKIASSKYHRNFGRCGLNFDVSKCIV